MIVQVGTKIRAYDFPVSDDDFMEGEVIYIDEDTLHCRTSRHVVGGQDVAIDREFGNNVFATLVPGESCFDAPGSRERTVPAGTDR